MKTVKCVVLVFSLSLLGGCGQQLVQFFAPNDFAVTPRDDMAVGNDLAVDDLGAADLAAVDLSGAMDRDLGAPSDAGSDAASDGGGDGFQSQRLMVIAVSPLNLATGVPTFRAPSATFNHPMDPVSLSRMTFVLQEQGVPDEILGTVQYSPATSTVAFIPASPLLVGTTYIATITTLARDTLGDTLAVNFVWSFQTSAQECGMAPVVLGEAGNFAVLASTGVTNAGPTIINGDVGVSPGTALVGFGPSPGVGGPGIVNGSQHASDSAANQGAADLTTAGIDAAGRSLCFVLIADGELGGKTFTPGLYRSGISSFAISAGDLTLDAQGDSQAVFIFQTSVSTLTIANGRAVILAGGAKAANVFWSVGTQAVIGTTAVVKGTILAGTMISMDTGATLEGRALAETASVTLLSNTVTIPAP